MSVLQGVTIKKGTNIVIHGHRNMPDSMYYLMLSRAQQLEQIFMEGFNGKIKARDDNIIENKRLVERSITQFYIQNPVNVYMVNIPYKNTKENIYKFISSDPYASNAHHICIVESCLGNDKNLHQNFSNR